jgi:deoxyribonuclease V
MATPTADPGPPPARWPRTVAEAEAEQDRLRPLVVTTGDPAPRTVAGLDVAYQPGGDRLVAAVVVLRADDLTVVESATSPGRAAFGYVPGLFAFRELPALLAALESLRTAPDLLVCDGQGLAHPRRFGLACHLGVLTGLPAVGVGKTRLVGSHDEPGPRRGDAADLLDAGEVVGRVLRTRDGVKPVYVSVGHRIGLDAACRLTLRLTPRYRLPETTRAADHLSRTALAAS